MFTGVYLSLGAFIISPYEGRARQFFTATERNSFLLSMKEETIFNFKEESAKGGFAPRRPLWKPLLDFEVKPLGAKRQRPLWIPLLNREVSLLAVPHSSAATACRAAFSAVRRCEGKAKRF